MFLPFSSNVEITPKMILLKTILFTVLKNGSEFQFLIDAIEYHSPKCINVRIL